MNEKERLQQEINKLHNKLDKINEKEAAAVNILLMDKCFRYRNSYSCPEKPSDYWWLYQKVIRIKGRIVTVFAFQKDSYGEVFISKKDIYPNNLGEEISEKSFQTAWIKTLEYITAICPIQTEDQGE